MKTGKPIKNEFGSFKFLIVSPDRTEYAEFIRNILHHDPGAGFLVVKAGPQYTARSFCQVEICVAKVPKILDIPSFFSIGQK